MKLDIIKSKGLDIEWRITVPSRDLSPKFEEEYSNLSKNVKLPGFRPGKVPLKIVKQKYAQNVTQKILDEVINFSLRKTAAEKKIQPSIQPKVKVEKYEEGGDLIFSAVFQIMPEVPDIDLKNIKVEKSELLIDEKDTDKTLQELAKNHERFEPLKKENQKKGI